MIAKPRCSAGCAADARHPSFLAADHVACVQGREARAHLGDRGDVRRLQDHDEVLWTGRASEHLCAVLPPLVRDLEAGKLRFKLGSIR